MEEKLLDATTLLNKAKASGHKEAYRMLVRNLNYRIGVGVRLKPPNIHTFFVETTIHLCPSLDSVDLDILEKGLTCLKELKTKNYVLTCQDDNCVSCEVAVPASNLTEEYTKVTALMKAVFG
jgi:hypothetical protein